MRVLRAVVAILGFCIAAAAHAQQPADVVNLVSQSSYIAYHSALYTHAGDNRGIGGAQHDLARTVIYDAFSSFGLTTTLDPFTYAGSTYYNVVGVKTGAVHPDSIYLVGCHYDSVNNPGADDNASGVAGVLEAARVMSQFQFDSTVVFVGFDREEQGLIGSSAWAEAHKTSNIAGAISLDMIAYNPATDHDKAYVYGRTTSDPLKNVLAAAVTAYGNGITPVIGGDTPYSDHAPFEARGFQGALLIEYNWRSNPYYHRLSDSVESADYIDYAYATSMTRSAVGCLATAAIVVPEPDGAVLILLALAIVRRQR